MTRLALHGGAPVRDRAWPDWPFFDDATEKAVVDCLRSGRWAVSWRSDGTSSVERRFAEAWARYNDVPYCVSVDHGSSALVVALEALDIGPGDEVVVPTMTWVAPATAVLRVGALPVLADVDGDTGCLTPQTLRAALSPRTRAVVVVHMNCTVADIEGILAVASAAGVEVIEDCAQAHGAEWRGRPVGGFGAAGAFSFQNGKVLAAGEGGAVVTSDESRYVRLQQLRADSRRYPDEPVVAGQEELVKEGTVMGANYCMPELCAAVLLDRLPRLDEQHDERERTARELETALADLGSFSPIPLPAAATRRSIFRYGIRFEPGTFGAVPVRRVSEALSAELNLPLYPPDAPLHRSMLFRPETKRRFAVVWSENGRRRSMHRDFAGAERFGESTLLFHHAALLGGSDAVADIVTALDKVRRSHSQL
jgi:dTDP-4-amino-4,6-dideoxygalactose transaminase